MVLFQHPVTGWLVASPSAVGAVSNIWPAKLERCLTKVFLYVHCRTDRVPLGADSRQNGAGKSNATPRSMVEMNYQEIVMNKNQVKGRIKEAEGKVKEVTGQVVGNKSLEEKGKVQAGYGDLKDDLKKSD